MTPDVLQGTINVKIKEDGSQENEINLVNEFISYVKDNLGLVQTPKIDFSDDIDHVKEQRSFGYFLPDANIIWVYAGDRNTADIFRTLAHELIHRKQEEDGKINYESGETGSDIENEANAKAGVFLRDFGKKHDGIYDTPIKKFIKSSINEVKIQPSNINFTFPFWITKQNKSQAPFIADQLNKQGYTLNGRNGRKIEVEDITFNIPTILDYDNNYRDKPERKILNTYSPSYEVKIQPPLNFNFNNTKTVVGVSKVATDLFVANYYMELLDLGSYYTFIPGAEPPIIFLIPKEYIDTPENIQHLAQYSEPLPGLYMRDIKKLVQDNKIEIVKKN